MTDSHDWLQVYYISVNSSYQFPCCIDFGEAAKIVISGEMMWLFYGMSL